MMQQKFRIILYSKIRFVGIFFSFIVFCIPVTLLLLPLGLGGQIGMGVYLIIGTILSFFIFPRYISQTILIISFDKEGFQFECIKPYWGSKIKSPTHVNWIELKSYKYESSYNFSTLKLRLVSGKTIKFHRWFFDENDDFDKFMTQFKRNIQNYNKKKGTETAIEREKLMMENKTFLIVTGVIIGMIIIAAILLIFIRGVHNIRGGFPLLIVLGPLIWVIIQIVRGLMTISKRGGG